MTGVDIPAIMRSYPRKLILRSSASDIDDAPSVDIMETTTTSRNGEVSEDNDTTAESLSDLNECFAVEVETTHHHNFLASSSSTANNEDVDIGDDDDAGSPDLTCADLDYLEAFVDGEDYSCRELCERRDSLFAHESSDSTAAMGFSCLSDSIIPYSSSLIFDNDDDLVTDRSSTIPSTAANSGKCDSNNVILEIEDSFCRDFTCCGLVLGDMHELLQHYEDCHVQVETYNSDYEDYCPMTEHHLIHRDTGGEDVDNESVISSSYSAADSSVSCSNEGPISAFDDSVISPPVSSTKNFNRRRRIRNLKRNSRRRSSVDLIDSFEENVESDDLVCGINDSDLVGNDNPLIRRVGDVEDDLGLSSVLEWMHEEYERNSSNWGGGGSKRLKMMADLMATSSGADVSDDEMVDVVTIEGAALRRVKSNTTRHSSPASLLSPPARDPKSQTAAASASSPPQLVDENGNKIEKPYRCSYPGCDKAYKNPNGLKYHNIHGHNAGDDEEDTDYAARLLKPYVCNYTHCFKRYKNLNGLKYHIEKYHGFAKAEANQLATEIVKKTNARYGINARSVPAPILFAAIKEHEEKERIKNGGGATGFNTPDNFVNSMGQAGGEGGKISTKNYADSNFVQNDILSTGGMTFAVPATTTSASQKTSTVTLPAASISPNSLNSTSSQQLQHQQQLMKTLFFAPGQLLRSANGSLVPVTSASPFVPAQNLGSLSTPPPTPQPQQTKQPPQRKQATTLPNAGVVPLVKPLTTTFPQLGGIPATNHQTMPVNSTPSTTSLNNSAATLAYLQTLSAAGLIDLKSYLQAFQNFTAANSVPPVTTTTTASTAVPRVAPTTATAAVPSLINNIKPPQQQQNHHHNNPATRE